MMVSDKRAITWMFRASQRKNEIIWDVHCSAQSAALNASLAMRGHDRPNFRHLKFRNFQNLALKRCGCSLFQAEGTVWKWWHVISCQSMLQPLSCTVTLRLRQRRQHVVRRCFCPRRCPELRSGEMTTGPRKSRTQKGGIQGTCTSEYGQQLQQH